MTFFIVTVVKTSNLTETLSFKERLCNRENLMGSVTVSGLVML
jgi:hypothetical protein